METKEKRNDLLTANRSDFMERYRKIQEQILKGEKTINQARVELGLERIDNKNLDRLFIPKA